MKALLGGLVAVLALAWAAAWSLAPASTAHPWWIAYQQLLYLSGLLAIGLLSLATFLAARPAWLETPLGGMDRIYRTHKWAGILGGVFAILHWLIEMSDDLLKSSIGRAGRVPKEKFGNILDSLRHLAGDLGEWGFYLLVVLVAITLWQRFPYRNWRFLHRAMPVLYLLLAFHSVLLALDFLDVAVARGFQPGDQRRHRQPAAGRRLARFAGGNAETAGGEQCRQAMMDPVHDVSPCQRRRDTPSVLVIAAFGIGVAGDAIGLAAHFLVAPFPVRHLAVLAHPLRQPGDALRRRPGIDAAQQLGAVAAAAAVAGVGDQPGGDFSGNFRVDRRILAKMPVELAHHLPPRRRRQHRRGEGQVAAAAFFADQRLADRREEMAAAGAGAAEDEGGKAGRQGDQEQGAQCHFHRRAPQRLATKLSQSPFSWAVQARPRTSSQLRLNHFSTLAGSA